MLLEHSAWLAAEEADPEERTCLVEALADMRSSVDPNDSTAMFAVTHEFAPKLADVSHSPTTRLFTRVLSTLIANAPETCDRLSVSPVCQTLKAPTFSGWLPQSVQETELWAPGIFAATGRWSSAG